MVTATARAELPVDSLFPEPLTNRVAPGIVVPGPERPGTTGTNEVAAPRENKPAPEPKYNSTMSNWKLSSAPRATDDALMLRNSDVLRGRFVGLDATTLGWEMPGVQGLIRFRREGLFNVQLCPPAEAAAAAKPRWVVRLTTGNLVLGEDLALDGTNLVLRTSQAGLLRMPRAMISSIYQDAEPAQSAFRTVQNLDDWDRVTVSRGELEMIFRDLNLPEAALIEFDLPQRNNQNFQMHLPLSQPKFLYAEPQVALSFSGNNLSLQSAGENMFGGAESAPLPKTRAGRWRIAVGLSRAQSKATVYVDGKLFRTLQMPAPPLARAGGIVINMGGSGDDPMVRTLVLSRIGEDLALPEAKPDQDILRLGNGDAMAGKLESISATQIVCTGPFGRLELPLERLVAVMLATGAASQPRRREGDVNVQLVDGGNLTAELRQFAPDSLTLASDVFGEVKVARSAVRGVQFGLYAPAPKAVARNYYQNPDSEPGRVQLDSGVMLGGQLVGLANGLVAWQHEHSVAPILFVQTNVVFANPVATTTATNLAPLAATVQLTNGDTWRCELGSLDSQQLQVRTMFTAPLTIPRRHVSGIFPNLPAEGVLDAGPIERYYVPPANARGRPQTTRQYLRNEALPDRVCLQFDLVGQPGPWNLNAWLFAKTQANTINNTATAYMLSINDGNLSLQEISQGSYQQPTSASVPGLSSRGTVRVTWLADRAKKECYLLVDGKVVMQRRNIKVSVPGNSIQFTVSNHNICRVRDLVISEWKGSAESLLAPPTGGDLVRLHDWTTLAGPVEAIREGLALLPRGQTIALGKVAGIQFDPNNSARARRSKSDVRLTLVDGDQFTLNSPLIDQRGLVGTAEGLGTVIINAGAVRRLHFRPYDPPKKNNPNQGGRNYGGMFWE